MVFACADADLEFWVPQHDVLYAGELVARHVQPHKLVWVIKQVVHGLVQPSEVAQRVVAQPHRG